MLPPEVRVTADTVELMISCCTEFIRMVSTESNEVATKENRSMMMPDHVLKALSELGFDEFLPEVTAALEMYKEESKTALSRKADLRKTGAEQAGLSEEEQIALQQQMFAAARAQSMTSHESAAAMQAAYEQAMAAQAQALAQAGKAVPDHLQRYLSLSHSMPLQQASSVVTVQQAGAGAGGGAAGAGADAQQG